MICCETEHLKKVCKEHWNTIKERDKEIEELKEVLFHHKGITSEMLTRGDLDAQVEIGKLVQEKERLCKELRSSMDDREMANFEYEEVCHRLRDTSRELSDFKAEKAARQDFWKAIGYGVTIALLATWFIVLVTSILSLYVPIGVALGIPLFGGLSYYFYKQIRKDLKEDV